MRVQNEILRVNTNKMKDTDYKDSAMKRLNQELSPFRDQTTHDEDYVRAMWSKYTQLTALRGNSRTKDIKNDLPRVAAFMKKVEEGPSHPDSQTLQQWADGDLTFDDKQVRDYYIKQL